MAKERLIKTAFWSDHYTANLDPIEKLLFLYCLTSPDTNISGIYQVHIRAIAADTGIDKDMVLNILGRFERDGKIKYWDGWMVIKNFIKNQNQRSPMILAGIEKELSVSPQWAKVWIGYG